MLPTRIRRTGGALLDSPFDVFGREVGRIFHDAFEGGINYSYPVDVTENENEIHVEAELPGFKRNEVNVMLVNGVLTITAERQPAEPKGEQHLAERRYTRVSRSFSLPKTVDEGKVDAKLEDGVLSLTLHKREEVKPRRIEVK
jgi:HSP20 family protein